MSITINRVAFDLTYTDCPADFWEVPGAQLTVDTWGMDRLTRRFQGRLDRIAEELAKYKRDRDKKDSVYSWMNVIEVAMTESSPFAQLTVNYRGVYDGKTPPAVSASGFRKQSVQLNLAGESEDEVTETTSTLTYYAPYTTWRYVSKSEPKTAKYRTKIKLTSEALDVVSMSNSHVADLNFVNGSSLSSGPNRPLIYRIAPGKFNAVIELSTSQLDIEPAGKWFEVTETNELLLIPSSLARQPQRRVSI